MINFIVNSKMDQSNPTTNKQVSLICSYICDTKYNSVMFRIIESKYMDNEFLKQKLKDYENNKYIYVNKKKINIVLDTETKYKVYLHFDDFTDGEKYILY